MSKELTEVRVAMEKQPINWKRLICMFTGIILFTVVYYSPPWPDAVDPLGKTFALSKEAKGALAVFLLAGTWWVFEVLPINCKEIRDAIVNCKSPMDIQVAARKLGMKILVEDAIRAVREGVTTLSEALRVSVAD